MENNRTFRLPKTSESDAAGKLTRMPGTVEMEATKPTKASGVPRLAAKGFKTGFLDNVELSMANKPITQSIKKNRSLPFFSHDFIVRSTSTMSIQGVFFVFVRFQEQSTNVIDGEPQITINLRSIFPASNSDENSMTNVIETNQLTRAFNSLTAVDKLNITVESGEIFGLLGPNGAGKTTTISMLCTILKPTAGTAKVNGFDIVKEATQVRKSIGIVFQDPSVDDRLTGRENLYMHANLYGVPASEQKSRIEHVLKLVELQDRADDLLRTYSGGMRRRLELARGLIHYPKVLFLDEPTLGLDPQTRDHVWRYIRELKESHDITVVLTTHYMDEADRLSDRIAIMDYGKIIALDTPTKLKETLEGDVVIVKTNNPTALAALATEKMGLQKTHLVNGTVEITVRNGESTLPRIVETATQNKIYIESISLRAPNLEDVFLHYTGRMIRADSSREPHGIAAIKRRTVR